MPTDTLWRLLLTERTYVGSLCLPHATGSGGSASLRLPLPWNNYIIAHFSGFVNTFRIKKIKKFFVKKLLTTGRHVWYNFSVTRGRDRSTRRRYKNNMAPLFIKGARSFTIIHKLFYLPFPSV